MPTEIKIGDASLWWARELTIEEQLSEVIDRYHQSSLYLKKVLAENEALKLELTDLKKRQLILDGSYKGGCVYVFRAASGECKIGKSQFLPRRVAELESGLPFRLKYVMAILSGNIDALEFVLHQRFSKKRVRGEWYKLTTKEINALRSEYANSILELSE